MEHLNLLGFKVNSLLEALSFLKCEEKELLKKQEVFKIEAFEISVYIFYTNNNDKFCYSTGCFYMESKQYN